MWRNSGQIEAKAIELLIEKSNNKQEQTQLLPAKHVPYCSLHFLMR
jgi:hypothetical protein